MKQPCLCYFDHQNIQRCVFLDQKTIWIGRADVCHIRLNCGSVSRKHAEIYWEKGRFWVRDCHSDNGTWINGQQITSPYALQHGDILECGVWKLEYREADGSIQDRCVQGCKGES